jgi:hypothetical protein
MTNEEFDHIAKQFWDFFDGNLPNPEHEPIRFMHYVKMFKYYKGRENEQTRGQD